MKSTDVSTSGPCEKPSSSALAAPPTNSSSAPTAHALAAPKITDPPPLPCSAQGRRHTSYKSWHLLMQSRQDSSHETCAVQPLSSMARFRGSQTCARGCPCLVATAAVQSWRRYLMLRMRSCMRYTLLHAMDELSACRPERCRPASYRPAATDRYSQHTTCRNTLDTADRVILLASTQRCHGILKGH